MEDEERNAKCNTNNMTMDTFCHQSLVTTNTQGEIANMTNERRIYLEIMAETIKGFNGYDSTGRKHCRYYPHIDYPSSDWFWTLGLPN